MRKCEVDGCSRPYLAKGMCRPHYEAVRYKKKPSDRGDIATRFWRKVVKGPSPEDCWVWVGSKNAAGYGTIWGGAEHGRPRGAHRVSYEIHHGPAGNGVVMHSCDNPECTNPGHLILGTHHLNTIDKVSKKRHEFGEHHHGAKLSDDDVRFIRSHPEMTIISLMDLFGVSQSVVSNIRAGKAWRHVV